MTRHSSVEDVLRIIAEHAPSLALERSIALAEALAPLIPGLTEHDRLVDGVMQEVRCGRKIHAIKELRASTGCGLREAKDAVEDPRVWGFVE